MLTTDDCEFYKETGDLCLSGFKLDSHDRRYPNKIEIKSAHTGRVMLFVPIKPDHPRYDEDGWDGEIFLYEPVEPCNVKVLTVAYDQ